jgi:predicted helicase
MPETAIKVYLSTVESALKRGDSTEHTHRAALASLFESIFKGVKAVNEPSRIDCGAPDLLIAKGPHTVGYIEAKDVGKSLDEAEKTAQWERYRHALHNLILTDYLEFRWYTDGELRLAARLGTPDTKGKIHPDVGGVLEVEKLIEGFLAEKPEKIKSPKDLAVKMARMAHMAKELIEKTLSGEAEKGSLHLQLEAFKENLIPDLSHDKFADMYAQTMAYGLFAARCNTLAGKVFERRAAAYLIPKTNPFLRNIFNHIAGPELDERIAWLVDDLTGLLADADMDAVLKGFGKMTGHKDPVVHFYETFLSEYDPKLREMRGVYYTPEEVVSYIVRSVDWLLKNKLGVSEGLADKDALILDPAVGTATFLFEVIKEIYNSPSLKSKAGAWDGYVSDNLLSRIFGFELLMAPYAIAHLKLGLLLKETGYSFEGDERLGIYLTNTLEEAVKHSDLLLAKWLTDEANSAAVIKKDKPIMVVLGNPPYSGHSANVGDWITRLIKAYKTVDGAPLGERNPKWLQDDYVKFIRFGQWRIERTGQGILAFITNHGYLDNPTFRGMRQSLMETFDEIYIYNLHGNSKKKEKTPEGGKDENVFDIQQGVAITLMVKRPAPKTNSVHESAPGSASLATADIWNRPITTTASARRRAGSVSTTAKKAKREETKIHRAAFAKIFHSDLWGLREDKYYRLLKEEVSSTVWKELTPHSPHYLFVPMDESLTEEYEKGWGLKDIFPINGVGMTTARDGFVIDFEKTELINRIKAFRNSKLGDEELHTRFRINKKKGWNIRRAWKLLQDIKDEQLDQIAVPLIYRPFDERYIFWQDSVVWRTVKAVMRHMIEDWNIGLLATRQTKESWSVLVTDRIAAHKSLAAYDINSLFPLYVINDDSAEQQDLHEPEIKPNLSDKFIQALSKKLGLEFISEGVGTDEARNFGPEDVFNYAYAVFHSPTYRRRYSEFLKSDFPRLPITSNRELFFRLADKGSYLVDFHLLEPGVMENIIVNYPVSGSQTVEKVSYDESTTRVYINKTQYFEGVPPEVWDFHVGGYRVCEKWLKDRKGRKLGYDDIDRYGKIVTALGETMRLMGEIDALIPGWPIS